MEYLSSMFIDNELTLDEKENFVEKIQSDPSFCQLTLDLINQERLIRKAELKSVKGARHDQWQWIKPAGLAMASLAAMVLIYIAIPSSPKVFNNRFVIYQPDATQVEMVGSFTGWQKIPLTPVGDTGYWQINLPLESGEYRFAYILNGDRKMPDPTCLFREQDDFGGENSILTIGT